MLNYWNETLENISQDQRKDKFLFIVNKIRIEVPLSYALGISPLITKKHLKDPTFREFEIEDKKKIEEEFLKFIRGKEIKKEIFLKIGMLLQNKEMIKKWKNSNELSNKKVIENIKSFEDVEEEKKEKNKRKKDNKDIQYNINKEDIQEELEYIGKHFEDMKEDIKNLRSETIIDIIRKEDISVKSENTIWEIIKERVKELKREKNQRNRKMRRILLENIQIKYLDEQNFKEYIEEIEAEDFSNNSLNNENEGTIWKQLQDILLNNTTIGGKEEKERKRKEEKERKKKNNKYKLIEHRFGNNFNGIINYLKKVYGEKIHPDIITVSTSSRAELRENVIEDSINHWQSINVLGEWWQINFKKMKVKMSGYSLKTYNFEPYHYNHLKNWVIEGRNEDEEWKEIDRQDNNDLNGNDLEHYYSLPKMTEPYQYFRIKCIGRNHAGVTENKDIFYLTLKQLEIFGEIIESETSK